MLVELRTRRRHLTGETPSCFSLSRAVHLHDPVIWNVRRPAILCVRHLGLCMQHRLWGADPGSRPALGLVGIISGIVESSSGGFPATLTTRNHLPLRGTAYTGLLLPSRTAFRRLLVAMPLGVRSVGSCLYHVPKVNLLAVRYFEGLGKSQTKRGVLAVKLALSSHEHRFRRIGQ